MTRPRLAIVVSHPIQHFCPQYESWAERGAWHIRVFFGRAFGRDAYRDAGFGAEIQWDGIPLGFDHVFLEDLAADGGRGARSRRRLEIALREFGPDAVIVYGYRENLQRRAIRWAIGNGKRVLMISDSELRSFRAVHRRLVKWAVLPRIYRAVDAFLTVGDANEDYLRHYGVRPERMFRVPFPIDVRLYDREALRYRELREAWRSRHGIPDDGVLIGTVGKLVGRKRQLDLIMAHKRLRAAGRNVFTVIVGSGPMLAQLRRAAGDALGRDLIFTGFVTPAELPAVYASMDVYAHPAEKEPHSLAISEAIYMGRPVVLSNRCGSFGETDDVRPGRNGTVYPCGAADALLSSLEGLVLADRLRAEFSAASRTIGRGNQRRSHLVGPRDALRALGLMGW